MISSLYKCYYWDPLLCALLTTSQGQGRIYSLEAFGVSVSWGVSGFEVQGLEAGGSGVPGFLGLAGRGFSFLPYVEPYC